MKIGLDKHTLVKNLVKNDFFFASNYDKFAYYTNGKDQVRYSFEDNEVTLLDSHGYKVENDVLLKKFIS